MKWRDNPKLHIAVGVTVSAIFLYWLFTGDLLLLADAAVEPDDGKTKSVTVLAVVWPMFLKAMAFIGVSVVGWVAGIWDFVAAKIEQTKQSSVVPADNETKKPLSRDDILLAMGRAASEGDLPELMRVANEIRKPTAIQRLAEAVEANNVEDAKLLYAELEALMKPVAKDKT